MHIGIGRRPGRIRHAGAVAVRVVAVRPTLSRVLGADQAHQGIVAVAATILAVADTGDVTDTVIGQGAVVAGQRLADQPAVLVVCSAGHRTVTPGPAVDRPERAGQICGCPRFSRVFEWTFDLRKPAS